MFILRYVTIACRMIMTMITKMFDNYNGDDNNYKDNDNEKFDSGDNEYENDNDIENNNNNNYNNNNINNNNNNNNNNNARTEKYRLCGKAQESVTHVLPGCSAT